MKKQRRMNGQRGDTIIEVMLAITVFALVATGSLALMNRGVAIAQRSLEITLVRQEMNDQAEMLRFIQQEALAERGDYQAVWSQLTGAYAQNEASDYGLNAANRCRTEQDLTSTGHEPFILDPQSLGSPNVIQNPTIDAMSTTVTPYPQIVYQSSGNFLKADNMWIESVPQEDSSDTETRFVDFHIRACWASVGADTPMTLGTIVRLYEN